MPTPHFDPDRMRERLEQQRTCLLELRGLSARQPLLIEQGAITQLLDLLASKQAWIGRLQALQSELAALTTVPDDQRTWRSPAQRAECATLLAECRGLWQQIFSEDTACQERLRTLCDETAAALEGTHVVSHAHAAYADSQPHRRQLDLSSGD